MAPQKGPDGELSITFPMDNKKLPGIAAEDIGKSAYGIFKAGDKLKNKSVGIAGEHLTGQQMADVFSSVYGKKVQYNAVEPSLYRSFDFPGADDLGNMFQLKADFEEDYCRSRDVEKTRELDPELLSFQPWLLKNKDRMQV